MFLKNCKVTFFLSNMKDQYVSNLEINFWGVLSFYTGFNQAIGTTK